MPTSATPVEFPWKSVASIAFALMLAAGAFWVFGEDLHGVREVRIHADQTAAVAAAADPRPTPLRVLVASMISPGSTMDRYAGLVAWLGRRLDREAVLVQRRNYFEGNEAVRRGEVDLAFVCSGAYVRLERDGHPADLLVAPIVRGQPYYRAVVIVPTGSAARNLQDLRGKHMAYTDPLSLTGRQYVQHRLHELGAAEETFFAQTQFTGSHDRSIDAVALGLVDAASVDELVYLAVIERKPEIGRALRVLETSQSFGIPPVVVPHTTPAPLRAALTQALTTMHESVDGRHILQSLGVDRFAVVAPSLYDSVRAVETP